MSDLIIGNDKNLNNYQPTLKTDRLILRPYKTSDAEALEKLASDKRIAEQILLPHPYPKGAANDYISTHSLKWDKNEGCFFAIILIGTGELIGNISIEHIKNKSGKLGYWIGCEFWGKGYCIEAGKCIVRFGFSNLHLNRIYAAHLSSNVASGKVLLNLGFDHIGSEKREFRDKNRVENFELFEKKSPV